jgi:hypothetical protein
VQPGIYSLQVTGAEGTVLFTITVLSTDRMELLITGSKNDGCTQSFPTDLTLVKYWDVTGSKTISRNPRHHHQLGDEIVPS